MRVFLGQLCLLKSSAHPELDLLPCTSAVYGFGVKPLLRICFCVDLGLCMVCARVCACSVLAAESRSSSDPSFIDNPMKAGMQAAYLEDCWRNNTRFSGQLCLLRSPAHPKDDLFSCTSAVFGLEITHVCLFGFVSTLSMQGMRECLAARACA